MIFCKRATLQALKDGIELRRRDKLIVKKENNEYILAFKWVDMLDSKRISQTLRKRFLHSSHSPYCLTISIRRK